jgi:hypothetical protein
MVAGVAETEMVAGPGGRLVEAEQMIFPQKTAAAGKAATGGKAAAAAKGAGAGFSIGGWGPLLIIGLLVTGGYLLWKKHQEG